MMRSLSSAVAGLRSHQTKMDVIGNNIANVNTYGYKASRTTFTDVYYQTLNTGRGAAGNTRGGQNPTQIGYGSQVATIDMFMNNGGGAFTGRPYDVYVDGDGFLTVQDADGRTHFSRLGNLTFDNDGWLVDYSGYKVMGIKLDPATGYKDGTPMTSTIAGSVYWDVKDLTQIKLGDATTTAGKKGNIRDFIQSISIGSDGSITAVVSEDLTYTDTSVIPNVTTTFKKDDPIYLGKLAIGTFANPYGLTERGQSYFDEAPNSGQVRYTVPDQNGAGKTKAGYLEMANVDLAQEFTDMITTQRGFQANTRIITVSDEMLQELVNLKR